MNISVELLTDTDAGGFLVPEEFSQELYLFAAGWQPPAAFHELNAMYDWLWGRPSWWLWLYYHCFLFKRWRQRVEGRRQGLNAEVDASKQAYMEAHPDFKQRHLQVANL